MDRQRERPPPHSLATLVVEAHGADCWGSEPIYKDGRLIGYATSGGYGWRVGRSLCVGWVETGECVPGNRLEIQILGERRAAAVVADPIYDPTSSRMKA